MDKLVECYSCELRLRRDKGEASLWDNIYRTPQWDVVHSYNTGLLGWLVMIPRRHIAAIDELNDAEASELGVLMRQVSKALKDVTGCQKTYVLQFAEHPQHPHVHFHIVPRMPNQPDDRRGPKIMEYQRVPESEYVNEETMNQFAKQIQLRMDSANDK